jgi:uncharacterized protein with HEPN domain
MSKQNNRVYLRHIADSIARVEELVARGGRVLFDQDFAIQNAVVRELEVIGEAAAQIGDDFWAKYPELPKKEMIGMRHRLIHGYAEVDLGRVWDTATSDIPKLKQQVEKIMTDEGVINDE